MKSLSKALKDYLKVRRLLGFKLDRSGKVLVDFLSFLNRQGASYITADLALRWATKPQKAQPTYWARRLSIVRLFAEYRSATDPRTEVPPPKLLPYSYRRKQPYLYTDEEVMHLIKTAKDLPSTVPAAPGLRAETYSTLFGLLAATGMRVREAIALSQQDVDWAEALLTIRETKFRKSRLVPIHPSTQQVLRQYARSRDKAYPCATTPAFFISEKGMRLGYYGVLRTFVRLSREMGLRGPSDSHGPRMHDLRHRFAVRTLLGWYRDGVDVEQHISELSTYLGHAKVTDTYWYLSATPELMQLAAARRESKKGGFAS